MVTGGAPYLRAFSSRLVTMRRRWSGSTNAFAAEAPLTATVSTIARSASTLAAVSPMTVIRSACGIVPAPTRAGTVSSSLRDVTPSEPARDDGGCQTRSMAEPMIRLDAVSKVFPGATSPAVDALSLDVPDGQIVVLVGPSGCGKTTTLKMINRLVEPTSGRITVEGTDVTTLAPHELRRRIGYVIQQVGLFPHRTIAQNIATVPMLLGWDKARIAERIAELIELMHLDPAFTTRYPAELSGGQQQRVGVARALAADPPVMLMDEPFGAVDPIVRGRLQDQFLELQQRVRKTIVMVTHDIDEAIKLGDRVAILNVGGILEQYGPPEEILREPANAFVEDFLGAERGLKRLSLIRVRDVPLERGPVADAATPAEDAVALAAKSGSDWVGVLDGPRLRGWLWARDLDPGTALGDHGTQPFKVWVSPDSTLREALDTVVNEHTGVAMVNDDDGYVGMLTVQAISGEILT